MTREELRAKWAAARAMRERRGLAQEQLARIAGVRVDALRSAEQGRASGRRTIDRVLAALDQPHDDAVERVRAAIEGER